MIETGIRVAICVATFRRNDELSRLLSSITSQKWNGLIKTPSISIFVADNDPRQGARAIALDWAERTPYPIHYFSESRPGIPYVRNLLVNVTAGFDFIAFVDDDETVCEHWIEELLSTQEEYSADVVLGPVTPVYLHPVQPWIVAGRFHASSVFPDGLTSSNLITWNVLIRRTLFDDLDIRFEEKMALTGGTDVLLGRQLRKRGVLFFWSSKALVSEIVPPERCTVRWLLQRRFRAGIVHYMIARHTPILSPVSSSLRFATMMLAVGVLKTCTSIVRGRSALVKGLGYIVQSFGVCAGISGVCYEEYRATHRK